MILGFNNNAASRIASDITSLQTTIPVEPNTGALFAKALTPDKSNPGSTHKIIAKLTLSDLKQTVWEICHLTAVDGDTLTVIRGQEGTTQRSWKLGDLIGNFSTRGSENNFLQIEQLQGGDYIYAEATGDGNTLVVSLPSTYTTDSWDLKAPIVISPNANNTGSVTIQLILGGMTIGTIPVYKYNKDKLNKSQLGRNDIIAGIPIVVVLSAGKLFFNILNPASIFNDYLLKSGGTITGSLTVQKDLTVNGTDAIRNPTASKLALETDDANKNGFIFQQVNDVLRLGTSKNGVLSDTIAFFNSTNKNIDFSANVLSQNKVRIMNDNDFLRSIGIIDQGRKGWYNLPGGLVIQWIKSSGGVNDGSRITFPKPFSNLPLTIVCSDWQGSQPIGSSNWNNSGFTVRMSGSSAHVCFLCVGY